MSRHDGTTSEVMAPYFAEIRDREIRQIWMNDTGIEFVFEAESGRRSLTLRGEIYWHAFKEPGGNLLRVNGIPLAGPKTPVAEIDPARIESIQLYETEAKGTTCNQYLVVVCREDQDRAPRKWLVEWSGGDEPEGIRIGSDLDPLKGCKAVNFDGYGGLNEQQGMFCAETYKEALEFASIAHARQRTPKGSPYMVHVHAVAMEVIQSLHVEPLGFDENTLAVCCALLHDTIEDTDAFEASLQTFGCEVAEGVAALTKDKSVAKDVAMRGSVARLKEQPLAVQRVKLADRICNLDPPPIHWNADKCRSYQREARLILRELHDASPYLARRLERKITDYDREIERFASHRYLVFYREVDKTMDNALTEEKCLLPLAKDAPGYFQKLKATLALNDMLYRMRNIPLFKSRFKKENELDYGLADDERLALLTEKGYRTFDLQQVYERYLAPLDPKDEWLQKQIQDWANACGVER